MIEIVTDKDEKSKSLRYRYLHSYCISCNTKSSNLISIRQDGGNSGTIISLCDKCLQELKKKIEDLEVENVEV
ncbi:hypothetical protein [Fusobacterium polymorphum]|uniref:hypothetical protein n=1 Tax=Fusobacterium nucleatum subsp. polymorphum TaxID=76857 RepID=UPI003008F70B